VLIPSRCRERAILLDARADSNLSCGREREVLGCVQSQPVECPTEEEAMAFCTKCGAQVADGTAFCPSCGAPQGAAAPAGAPAGSTGLAENVAGLLCYVLGWLTGLVFFLVDKRPFVRFHAAQSMVTFGGLHVLSLALGFFLGASAFMGGWTGWGVGLLVIWAIHLATLVLWVLCMVKAFQNARFKLPIAGDIAENIAK
jgi:uncharacterized membrane protein